MKLIIARLASEAFDSVSGELDELCVKTTTSEVHSPDPASLRLECVADHEQSRAVVRLLRGHTDDIMSVALRPAARSEAAARSPG